MSLCLSFLSSLAPMNRTSSVMSRKNGESGPPSCVPDLRGKTFLSPLTVMLAGHFVDAIPQFEAVPFHY